MRTLICVLALWCGSIAQAQSPTINPETSQSVTLTSGQRDEINKFIEKLRPDVFGENPGKTRRALEQLLAPLQVEGVSVAFRQVMAEALIGNIEQAVGDDRLWVERGGDERTINPRPYTGLRLAGEIATDRTLAIIRTQLENTDIGRRFFAIHCTEMVFSAVRVSAPAVTEQSLYRVSGGKASGLVVELGDRLVIEDSSRHAAAIVRSLGEAGGITGSQMSGVAANAIRMIGERTSERVKARRGAPPEIEERKVWITAGREVFPVVAQPTGEVGRETALAALRLAGHLVAS
ncbi:MAG: hypothetical protein K8E66_02875, partial [Phycisphaerales bacterium]|nr:hypothetical protein [Phycisphaerales bacterium]